MGKFPGTLQPDNNFERYNPVVEIPFLQSSETSLRRGYFRFYTNFIILFRVFDQSRKFL